MSYGGRLVLINSVLMSMPMFLLSFFEVPVGVRKRLDFYRSHLFWQSDEIKRKYMLIRWDIVCRPKDQGGLGVENLEIKNRCLLTDFLLRSKAHGYKFYVISRGNITGSHRTCVGCSVWC